MVQYTQTSFDEHGCAVQGGYMGFVAGNDPSPQKKASGPGFGWVSLLFIGVLLFRVVRNMTAGLLTDEQLAILVGGVIALIGLAIIVQRVNRSRANNSPSLPTTYQPQQPSYPSSTGYSPIRSEARPPTNAPRFEPIITGKVFLFGLVFACAWIGLGLLIFTP
jgi:hypothetical protein